MRITQEAKQATRKRILAVAQKLFRSSGFERTTTRGIASEAGLASGTLFNYFPTKEAIVLTLVRDALGQSRDDFEQSRRVQEASVEEDLFAHISAGLRRLKPYRKFFLPALETALSPLARGAGNEASEAIRVDHLEFVQRLLRGHGLGDAQPVVGMQLYWTLFTGVLAFWASDSSPKQEDTLALLDQSLRMFISWLAGDSQGTD